MDLTAPGLYYIHMRSQGIKMSKNSFGFLFLLLFFTPSPFASLTDIEAIGLRKILFVNIPENLMGFLCPNTQC